jgi:hypothetical protein
LGFVISESDGDKQKVIYILSSSSPFDTLFSGTLFALATKDSPLSCSQASHTSRGPPLTLTAQASQ